MIIIFEWISTNLNVTDDKNKELDLRVNCLILNEEISNGILCCQDQRQRPISRQSAARLPSTAYLSPWITQVRWWHLDGAPKRLLRGESRRSELAWQSTTWQATQQQLKARPTAPPRGGTTTRSKSVPFPLRINTSLSTGLLITRCSEVCSRQTTMKKASLCYSVTTEHWPSPSTPKTKKT